MNNSLANQTDETTQPETADRVNTLVTRLTDLLVEEVSAVDLAANRRKIVVCKKATGGAMLGTEHHEGATTDNGTEWTVDVVKENAPEQPKAESSESVEGAVWDTAFVNDLPDSAFLYIAAGGEKDGEDKTVPRSLRYFPVRDDKGELDLPHVRNALARIPQADIPDEEKDKAKAAAEKLLEELTAESTEQAEGAEEKDGADGKEKAGDAPSETEPSTSAPEKTDDETESSQDETAPVDKGAAEVAEALKLLQVALGRMVSGESLDAEAHESVSRAREILARMSEPVATEEPAMEGEEAAQKDGDREPQAKAGAKMASARRKEFKDALDSLIKIFESILPEKERKSWPKPQAKAEPQTEESTELAKAESEVNRLRAELENAKAEVKSVNVELAKAKDRPFDSNVVPVDKASGEGQSFTWGFDLNDQDS